MENAELYSSASGMQKRDAVEVLAEFRDRLCWRKGPRVLDVGCGSGEVTTEILLPRLPKDFRELIGLDISLEMIQHARNVHSHPKVSFLQFDLAQPSEDLLEELTSAITASQNDNVALESQDIRLLLNNQKILECEGTKSDSRKCTGYDVIFSFYCLHWVADQRLAVRNIYRLLMTGGESLLVFLVKSPIFTLYRKLSAMEPWKKYMQDVENFIPFYQDSEDPRQDFRDILDATGFEILTVECKERSYLFDSFSSLRSAITAVNPFLSRLSYEQQEEFTNECLRQTEFLKLAEFKNNTYRVSYKLIVAHIRKPT